MVQLFEVRLANSHLLKILLLQILLLKQRIRKSVECDSISNKCVDISYVHTSHDKNKVMITCE